MNGIRNCSGNEIRDSRTTLLFYPLVGAVIGLIAYWIRCRKDKKYFIVGLVKSRKQ